MTEPLWGYLITGVITILVTLLLWKLKPKVQLVYFMPHHFLFELTTPPLRLLTHSITVQNLGGEDAGIIEIVHKTRPDFFVLQPARDFEESSTPAGEHIVRVKSLGQKEFFTIEFLSYNTIPALLYIRSKAGLAKLIQTLPTQVIPAWLLKMVFVLFFAGLATTIFGLVKISIFVLRGIGLLH